ncbi:HNH endonuclease [Roseateles toxinivorans]|uniref:HNH endonuclease n=1 Tax=Roseateles toxinivorans TaxID=270368 RepID=UPI001FB5F3A7|nr:HNH endonuclease signature motif containing protein [Roseateles toxinivorans]
MTPTTPSVGARCACAGTRPGCSSTADLTGLLNIDNVENYDHIVPLSSWWLNDITNLQLLCVPCNQYDKRDGVPITSGRYQSWYPMEDSES